MRSVGEPETLGSCKFATALIPRGSRGSANGRPWQASISVDREVISGLAVNAGFYRTWFGNFSVTDNLLVTPGDYDPYQIVAPVDPRLGSVSGSVITGLYDISNEKFGQVDSVVTLAENFGEQTEESKRFRPEFHRASAAGWASLRRLESRQFRQHQQHGAIVAIKRLFRRRLAATVVPVRRAASVSAAAEAIRLLSTEVGHCGCCRPTESAVESTTPPRLRFRRRRLHPRSAVRLPGALAPPSPAPAAVLLFSGRADQPTRPAV